ncbi:MAG: GntR family transcriptional regulator [Planctomycetota bacterium]|nr:GntR family transcriptional regulator [Planctomycetota bacterium]
MQALLSQQVYDQLYEALLDHRLKPGDRLNRRQVAEDLGVSVAPVIEAMACRWSIGVICLVAAVWLTAATAADPKPTAAEAEATAAAWLGRLGDPGLVLDAKLAEPGFVVRQADSAIGRITKFELDQAGYRLSFAFRGEHTAAAPPATLRAAFWHAVIDRVPTPGLDLPGWETRPLTPVSSFDQGVELVDLAAGRATFRVKTEFFAISGRDPTVLVPADAPAPPGSFFQLRRSFPLDLTISAPVSVPE